MDSIIDALASLTDPSPASDIGTVTNETKESNDQWEGECLDMVREDLAFWLGVEAMRATPPMMYNDAMRKAVREAFQRGFEVGDDSASEEHEWGKLVDEKLKGRAHSRAMLSTLPDSAGETSDDGRKG